MSYDNWRKRLEIAKLPTVAARRAELTRLKLANMEPTHEDEGYYRIPITKKDESGNGRNVVTGYTAVAIFCDDGALVGVRGTEQAEMRPNEVVDSWTWFCSHPISYETYKAVAEEGEAWPEMAAPPEVRAAIAGGEYSDLPPLGDSKIPAANRDVARSDNNPPEVLPEVEHATAIDNAIAAALKTVTNEDEAARALGSKNRIAELRLSADKAGRAIYEPMYREYQRVQKAWAPMVARADTAEKLINKAILTFREKERQRLAKEKADADEAQRLIDEENERAAQRAIAAGEPEPPPVVIEVAPPAAPAPAPVVPSYGNRKLKENVSWHLDAVTDYDAVYTYFKDAEPLKVVLKTLATAAVKAGRTVPGTKTHEGLV